MSDIYNDMIMRVSMTIDHNQDVSCASIYVPADGDGTLTPEILRALSLSVSVPVFAAEMYSNTFNPNRRPADFPRRTAPSHDLSINCNTD